MPTVKEHYSKENAIFQQDFRNVQEMVLGNDIEVLSWPVNVPVLISIKNE